MKNCPACNADLTEPGTVTRTYISKSPDKYIDSYSQGHYEEDTYEPDTEPTRPLEHHDLVDGSDVCTYCDHVLQ